MSTDSLSSHRGWARRLHIPYPLLTDPDRAAGDAFGLVRRFGVGGWTIDLFRRATLLADARGVIVAAWANVKPRGHAAQVLAAAQALGPSAEGLSRPSA